MACLILTAMIWGFAFVSQVQGMASMTPLFFNATRFTLGALSLLPLLWFRRRGKATAGSRTAYDAGERPVLELGDGKVMDLPKWTASPVAVSVICGVVLFSASTVQQYGVLYSGSAGRSGFITALYIVMTPLLAFVVLRRRIHLSVVISVAIAVVGFYLLCVTDGFGSITIADVVLLFTAVLFATHILVIDTFGRKMDVIALSFGQIATTAVLSWVRFVRRRLRRLGGSGPCVVRHSLCGRRIRRHSLHPAGGRTAIGATHASIRDHVPRIVLFRNRRCTAAW